MALRSSGTATSEETECHAEKPDNEDETIGPLGDPSEDWFFITRVRPPGKVYPARRRGIVAVDLGPFGTGSVVEVDPQKEVKPEQPDRPPGKK